ncbi:MULTISPECIES: dihydroxyacetone kinase phosphoryl donor subunit DhaM [Exiguobacterium]|uniref:dihydroxyacetone kinase phosphoryl donor subunit DhaM n=1 Tax=Exiguobacterium TaxID=33986 RepID=UPI0004490338|nr:MULTISPECIES: dihydroxyacetone kinase phosphoryl donor subunit DhaM [Exiguobacterium]EZP61684.1 Dihydroxyacetone kinase [Exiguobacterium sp. RIT341]MDQ6466272.1 dihydroxyacetone kinase phosphoryl donor subunit DhaM [Exiguobacterium acetylicum]HAL01623.1 PTS-dependent dihydroxyacetone kinase phosphotransferase subunit DhaM [Exiguobacterium sp.]HCV51893.1 PTS-dependent dihydroxyacetone kinase phosphotransferase subunit DhaM [Exiguobacterium sp.]
MVNLVLVSHSEKLAAGLKELLAEMAPDTPVLVAAGLEDGSIGTDATRIEETLNTLDDDGVVLTDIGSATMNTELALELYSGERTVRFIDAPLVEGAFLAAVLSGQSKSVDEIEDGLKNEFGK